MNCSDNKLSSLFTRCHFDNSIILVCVRWYLTYKLSYRDLVAIMAERNVDVAHTTILRWVQRYVQSLRSIGSVTPVRSEPRGESMRHI